MSQTHTTKNADYIVAVDMGDSVYGTLFVEKTEINIPVDGTHYVILSPTSRALKEQVEEKGVKTIGYKTLLEELVDTNDDNETIQRELIIRGSNTTPIYFSCQQNFSEIITPTGKKLFLLSPKTQIPADLSNRIANSVKQNY